MADLNESEFHDEAVETVPEFAVDLNCVVVANHRFTLEGITRAEDEEIAGLQETLALEDSEVTSSVLGSARNGFDELRRAANRLALVGVVTRLQHWMGRFVRQRNLKPPKTRDSTLVRQLKILNETLGDGPVPVSDFEELVEVRDSIIHADGRVEWKDKDRDRKVADQYRSTGGDVELSEEQLKEAVEKAIRQVSWYDERLRSSP